MYWMIIRHKVIAFFTLSDSYNNILKSSIPYANHPVYWNLCSLLLFRYVTLHPVCLNSFISSVVSNNFAVMGSLPLKYHDFCFSRKNFKVVFLQFQTPEFLRNGLLSLLRCLLN